MHQVVLSLGSNLGDRKGFLLRATDMLTKEAGTLTRQSSIYETPSWGFRSSDFLNQIIMIQTTLSPFQLLDTIQTIEKKLGREHKTRYKNGKPVYQDRCIDIDILYFDNLTIKHERLTVPHPEIEKRDFILKPLSELNISPDTGML